MAYGSHAHVALFFDAATAAKPATDGQMLLGGFVRDFDGTKTQVVRKKFGFDGWQQPIDFFYKCLFVRYNCLFVRSALPSFPFLDS